MAASAVAVVFLNSLAFGLSRETIFDSLVFTFFVASSVAGAIFLAEPRIEGYSTATRVAIISILIIPSTYLGVWLGTFFQEIANPFYDDVQSIPSPRTVIFSLVISYIFGLGGYLYLSSRDRLRAAEIEIRKKAEEEEKARHLANEARLASLESRIHPHFLFNTLNSIAALIKEDPASAEMMVEKLSRVLRQSLENGARHQTSLRDEVALARDYLDIQSVRFADRLGYEFDIDDSLLEIEMPLFSIHTLVENSLKHVAETDSKGTNLMVSAFRENGNAIVSVSDNGPGFSEKDLKEGHGLDNLRERMSVVFGGDSTIRIADSQDASSVSLVIPLDEK